MKLADQNLIIYNIYITIHLKLIKTYQNLFLRIKYLDVIYIKTLKHSMKTRVNLYGISFGWVFSGVHTIKFLVQIASFPTPFVRVYLFSND